MRRKSTHSHARRALFISISFGDKRAGVPPSPVLSDEADQSP